MGKKNSFEVEVNIAAVSGSASAKVVTVKGPSTVADIAREAGITDLSKVNLLVDGKPVTPETLVTAPAKATITERPKGS